MSDEKLPKAGDEVTWKTPQGETRGKVDRVATSPVKIKSSEVKASKDDPRVVVKSDKTGAKAAHKPASVHKQ